MFSNLFTNSFIIEVGGGLGNQMFQYAFYLNFKKYHRNTKIDVTGYSKNQIHNNYELDRIFKIQPIYACLSELETLLDKRQTLLHKVKRKIWGYRPHHYYEHTFNYEYKPWIFHKKQPTFLQGCWLSYKYFSEIEEELVQTFSFPPLQEKRNLELHKEISEKESVSIHIRRGDYLKSPIHKDICDVNYYKKAIRKLYEMHSQCFFILFSDDPLWTKDNIVPLLENNYKVVDWNRGHESYRDMQLMTTCKHNIIANSTFSWWGAWLNLYKNKIVISPSKWFNVDSLNNLSIIPENWIQL